jgi:hypothetical protein
MTLRSAADAAAERTRTRGAHRIGEVNPPSTIIEWPVT